MKVFITYLTFCLFGCYGTQIYAQIEEEGGIPKDSIPNPESAKTFEVKFFKALSERGIENFDKAIDILTELEKETKDEPVIYFQLGLNYFDIEQYDSALANFKKAEQLKPQDRDIKINLFEVYQQQKKYYKALEYASALAKEEPEYFEISSNIYFLINEYTNAISALNKSDQNLGYTAHKDKLRTLIYKADQNYNDAVAYFKKRISIEPYNPMHNLRLAEFLKLDRKYNDALKVLGEGLQNHPQFTRYCVLQTELYLINNEPQKSLSALKNVVTDRFLEEKYKVEAIDIFKNYVVNQPELQDDFIALLNLASQKAEDSASNLDLGLFYFDTDKPKALDNFRKALEQNPQDFEILKRIAVLEYQLEKYGQALNTVENALEFFPTQVVFMLVKANVYLAQAQYNQAKSVLEEAQAYVFEENETMLMLYESLSKAYQGLGKTEKAEKFKNKVNTLKSKLN